MAISYKRLWKMLIDRDLKKKDLVDMTGLSWSTIKKMGRNEHVSNNVLVKICTALQCEFSDIVEIVGESSQRSRSGGDTFG